MDFSYFQKINNTYESKSRQETDLYLLNRHVDDCFSDTIDYHVVERNGEPFELLIMKDTDGNTFKKKIKSKNSDPFNLGDYIKWQNQIWLVTLVDPNDKTYHSGYMYLCTCPLRWQNSKGEIIERWAYSEDFTKYSSGITFNNTVQNADNQYGLTLPSDSETRLLRRDMRFVIDFDDVEKPDVYELTNRKVMLNNNEYFDRGGTIIFTMSIGEFNSDTDKRVDVGDGKYVWICNYHDNYSSTIPSHNDKLSNLSAVISGIPELKVGYEKSYTVTIRNKEGIAVPVKSVDFQWNVKSDFDVQSNVNGDRITLMVDDESCIGSEFSLQCLIGGLVISEITISVVDVI